MIFTPDEFKKAEENLQTSVTELMQHAGDGIARTVEQFFPTPGTALCYVGKGHNGGDALIAAEKLQEKGWNIQVRVPLAITSYFRPYTGKRFANVQAKCDLFTRMPQFDKHTAPNIILDGLLGLGTTGELREPYNELCAEVNYVANKNNCTVFAIDIPSGLNAENGEADPDTVRADITLAIAHPKTGLIAQRAEKYVGRVCIVPVPELSDAVGDPSVEIITSETLEGKLPRRAKNAHKGSVGRIAILGGSRGMTGATALAARSALQFGAGLVTIYTEESLYPIQVSQVPPEVIVHPINDISEMVNDSKNDILLLGPGLSPNHPQTDQIWDTIHNDVRPLVLDAGALSILGQKSNKTDPLFSEKAGKRILTPHIGELIELLKKLDYPHEIDESNLDRPAISEWLLENNPATCVFKSATTFISEFGHPIGVNPTGHAGMATGGSGDILAGGIAALLGQGCASYDAACLATWICGRAAEIAVPPRINFTLTPTDTLANIKAAFLSLAHHQL